MGIYRNKRLMIVICVLGICIMPLLSACVTTMQVVDTKINTMVLLNAQGEVTNSISEVGSYTVVAAPNVGIPQIYYRHEDQTKLLMSTWNEAQEQWEAKVVFDKAGSYQFIVKWFNEEQLLEEWESAIYHITDVSSMLVSELHPDQSLFLQLIDDEGLQVSALLEDKQRGEVISISENELFQGYLLQQEGEWTLTLRLESDDGAVLIKKQAEMIVIDHTKPQLSIKAKECDLTKEALPLQDQPLSITLTAYDSHLDLSSLTVLVNNQVQAVTWTSENDAQAAVVSLAQDGTYVVQLLAKDHFGNECSIASLPIVIDQSEPKIHLFLDDKEISRLPEYINHEAILKCVIEDMSFDAKNSVLLDGKISYDSWQQNDDTWSLEVQLQEGNHDIQIIAEDLLHHQSLRREHSIVDSTRPLVYITYEALNSYQKEMTVSILVKDENIKANASMFHILYNNQPLQTAFSWEETKDGLQCFFTAKDEGNYEISLQLSDLAGNAAVYSYQEKLTDTYRHTFLLDKTAPSIDVSFAQPNITAKNQIVKVMIHDAHLLKENVSLEIEKDHKKYVMADSWQSMPEVISGSYEFSEEGSYTIKLQATDMAGNQSTVHTYDFIIDKQAPLISINRRQQMYFNKPLGFSIQIDDPYLAYYEIIVLQEQKQLLMYRGEISINQNVYVDQDGEYEIIVSGYDRAGNKNEQRDYFIIDQSTPKLNASFNGLPALSNDRFVTNQNIVLNMKWDDRYLKNEMIHITKNGKPLSLDYQNHALIYEFKAAKGQEDTYQINVSLSDEAGNRYDAKYELVIDTYLPPLRFVDDPFRGRAQNISWTPHLIMENEAFQISDAMLYRNQQIVPSYRWGDAIQEDGHYMLSIRIRDEAMNEATLIPPFAFTIDTTPPVIEILEEQRMEELLDQNVSLDTVLRLYISDGLSDKLNIHMLMLGDSELSEANLKKDEMGQWYYPLSFSKEGDIPLFIDVSDEAGNHNKQLITYHVLPHLTKEQVKTVEKKTAPLVAQTSENYYAVWILGAMACGLLFMIVRKQYAGKH